MEQTTAAALTSANVGCRFSTVSQVWRDASRLPYVWENRYRIEYGAPEETPSNPAGWRGLFETQKQAERNMMKGFGCVTSIFNIVDLQNGRYQDAERLYTYSSGTQDAMIVNICHSPCYWNSYCDDQVLSTELFFPRTSRKIKISEGNCPFMIQGDYILWTTWVNRYYFSGALWIEPKFVPLATAIKLSENAPSWWVDSPCESFKWKLNAPYDPDSYNNNYEIKCILNQNSKSNIVCIAEDPLDSASFTVRAFDLDEKGKPCFEKTINLRKGSSAKLLGFFWPYLVYSTERAVQRYGGRRDEQREAPDVPSFKIHVLNMKDDIQSEVMDCGNTGSIAAPMAAFSNDGGELAVAYNSENECRVGFFDVTKPSFPLVQETVVPTSEAQGISFNKIAVCRSKFAVILREQDHFLDYVDIYDKHTGKKLSRMLARAHGWHLSAPFRFLDPNRLLIAADDICLADFTASSHNFNIGLLRPDSQPSFTVQPASISSDRLLPAIAKHYDLFGSAKIGRVRSLSILEETGSRVILIYNSDDENKGELNSTATELARWFAGTKTPSKTELSPTSCPLNGVCMGSDVSNTEKVEWKERQAERSRLSKYPQSIRGDAFLVFQGVVCGKLEFVDLPERISNKVELRFGPTFELGL
eukprot:TRINITY_DN1181_c0_g1_i2.p1 TRINITY_DN1181_c0_g1~~TRINITY_DN1181_c0_g1_i2.p1  ORF type:complete len:643 (+),score=68.33 TRINITY_DN1181_c0_g1_i2:148-2076(+)